MSFLSVGSIFLSCARRVVQILILSAGLAHATSIDDFELRNFQIGGDFNLVNQFGERTQLSALQGNVVLLSFGFTHCPDICPTTLVDMKGAMASLGDAAQSAKVVFITVDPARDTAERLKSYLAFFDKDFIGLTGSEQEIADVAGRFQTTYEKQEPDENGQYSVDHSSYVFVIDQAGKTRYVVPYTIGAATIAEGVTALLGEQS